MDIEEQYNKMYRYHYPINKDKLKIGKFFKTHISHLRGKLRKIAGKEYIEAVWESDFG